MPMSENRHTPRITRDVEKKGVLARLIKQSVLATDKLQTSEELIEAARQVVRRIEIANREGDIRALIMGALGLAGLATRFVVAALAMDGSRVIEDVELGVIGLDVPGVPEVICVAPYDNEDAEG